MGEGMGKWGEEGRKGPKDTGRKTRKPCGTRKGKMSKTCTSTDEDLIREQGRSGPITNESTVESRVTS